MTTIPRILAAITALSLLGLLSTASAAPVGALTSAGASLQADAAQNGMTEQVTYRCWRRHGRVHCGNVRPQVYSYYYAPRPYYYAPRPYYYGYSSRPSFSFSLGGFRGWY